eukprot:CAMPEP_0119374710 /NCGR_PEP_ID=MMETSP1334-20130426/32348_1 /TAXON_ID=127549 /ORGANISM="Calcidiscus leptoporus, Strain RCC1130" /LENGTH=70 /DNA_ID=CAMNT_0007392841 /DNA_START=273 /DNA_END=485 /DNA_ORIENTATION=-
MALPSDVYNMDEDQHEGRSASSHAACCTILASIACSQTRAKNSTCRAQSNIGARCWHLLLHALGATRGVA